MRKIPLQLEKLKNQTNPLLLSVFNTIYENMDKSSFEVEDPDFVVFPAAIVHRMKAERMSIESAFYDALDQAYASITEAPKKELQSKKIGEQKSSFNIEGLSLMEHDEVELGILATQKATELTDLNTTNLAQFCMRIEKIVNHDLEISQLPIGPNNICRILKQSIEKIDLKAEEKAFVLKAFLTQLENSYLDILKAANDCLIKQGILPDIDDEEAHSRVQRSQAREEARENRQELLNTLAGTEDGQPVDMDAMFASIAKMLEESGNTEMVNHLIKGNAAAAPVSKEELLASAEALRPALPELPDGEFQYLEPQPIEPLAQQIKDKANLDEKGLSKQASSTIAMISLMFDNILNDESMAPEIKALLQLLQTPVLKAALQDENFLTDSNNPAQELLNEVAATGLSWSPTANPKRDNVYKQLTNIVKDVSDNFNDDYLVFDQAIYNLDEFNIKEKRRTSIVEERMIAQEKARVRTETAKAISEQHIEEKFAPYQLTEGLKQFFENVWKQALFFIYNRDESTESDGWQQAMHVENLIHDIFTGKNSTGALEAEEQLRAVLAHVGIDPDEIEDHLDALLPELVPIPFDENYVPPQTKTVSKSPVTPATAARPVATQASKPAKPEPTPAPPPAMEEDEPILGNMSLDDLLGAGDSNQEESTDNSLMPGEIDLSATSTDSEMEFSADFADVLDNDAGDASDTLESQTDVSTTASNAIEETAEPASNPTEQETPTPVMAEEPEPEPEYVPDQFDEMVGAITIGTWLQNFSDDSVAKVRVAAHIKHTDTYILVNRNGTKAGNYSRVELAEKLRNGEMHVLEDTLVFDRALESVITSLRR